MIKANAWALAILSALSLAAAAATDPPAASAPLVAASRAASIELAYGEVRKVDSERNMLTIKHGYIPSLDMPAMTMVFHAAKPGMLDGLKPGERIRFLAQIIGGTLTLTRIEKEAPAGR